MAGERILVVEDNAQNLKLVRDVLEFKGYQVIAAGTGEEGVELAGREKPALVLMDIQLPGISGVEAFQRIRNEPATADIPVVALTASAMPSDRKTILAAGFDGYETKPIGVAQLTRVVENAIAGREKDG